MDEKHDVAHTNATGPYDRELDLRTIVGFGVGLFVVTLVVLAVMWWMSTFFKAEEEAEDRPPSPIAEQQLDPIPPGPRLQAVPPRDMDELRAQDKEAMTSYGWVDRAGGVARIPVDRAIAILAEKGLPRIVAPAAPEEPVPSPAASSRAAPASSQVTAPAVKAPRSKKGPK
jgi:hypothetical protein